MSINQNVLKHFYKSNEYTCEFIKHYFIRLIRNLIIDPNTKILLDDGFKFFNKKLKVITSVPCDDSNFNEFVTFDYGFKNNIFNFPFTIKLHHNNFLSIDNYDEFLEIFNKMIKFRIETIKKGWAIKYGLEYDEESYPVLEDLSENELLKWVDPRPDVIYSLEKLTEEDLKR